MERWGQVRGGGALVRDEGLGGRPALASRRRVFVLQCRKGLRRSLRTRGRYSKNG